MCWRTLFKDTFLLKLPGSRDWLQKIIIHNIQTYFNIFVLHTLQIYTCVCIKRTKKKIDN